MAQDRLVTALGVISGTSMDGIDVALVETDGESCVRCGPGRVMPYPPALRAELLGLLADPSIAERDPLADVERRATEAFGQAVSAFLDAEGIALERIDLIGLHGQTIWHRPERRFTRQLGDGAHLARMLGRPVVARFRQADVAAGGQGAPLVPLYHAALAAELPKPLAVLNLGGVANITFLGENLILAFDTGPASALVDDAVRRRFGLDYDAGGAIAARGQVDRLTLARLLADPFFDRPPPKSLDRQAFHARAAMVEDLADQDAVATLAAFTVQAAARALEHVPEPPSRWLVAGGGRLNGTFMSGLRAAIGAPVDPVESVGWDGDMLEAQCFGYLAARSLKGLPLSLPTTTGVPAPTTGGVLHRP